MVKQVVGRAMGKEKLQKKQAASQGKKPEVKQKVEIQKKPNEMILVGEITGSHGIKGFVKVASLTDFAELRFAVGEEVFVEKYNKFLKIEQSQIHKGLYLLKLAGIEDRNGADALLHTYLKISQDALTELPKDNYYHFQLIGLEIFEGDKHLGTLSDVRQTGANDVYYIKTLDGLGGGEILLPALKTVILKVDLAANRMDVKIPEGLLD